jgi:uncharacterized HAD superfamily protein
VQTLSKILTREEISQEKIDNHDFSRLTKYVLKKHSEHAENIEILMTQWKHLCNGQKTA